MSFRDNRFTDWRGNHHLCGDVNFDGFVNLEDLELIRKQLGNSEELEWGTGPNQYNPNADVNMDGVIDEGDLTLVKGVFGDVSPWYCWHPNPSMINNGDGWTINSSDMAGEFPVGVVYSLKTEFLGKRGFKHFLSLNTVTGWGGGWTEVDFRPDAHYTFNPDWREVQPTDFPLEDLAGHEFIIDFKINRWELTGMQCCLGAYFGGWVILAEPYYMFCSDYSSPVVYVGKSNILEVMFAVKHQDLRVSFTPGGDKWHRIFYRLGPGLLNWEDGWFILQYILDDAEVDERTVVRLEGSKILSLLKGLGNRVYEKNPIPRSTYLQYFLRYDFRITNLNLNGAYFRPVYVSLDGYIDWAIKDTIVNGEYEVYGMYHYIKRKGTLWRPILSDSIVMNVS